jgi:hypothetical protein
MSYGKNNAKLLAAIDDLQPEGILIAGDILTAREGHSYERALHLLGQLQKKYPLYYGMGNHETRLFLYPETYKDMGERYERDLHRLGIELMRNTGEDLEDHIRVNGLEIERRYYKRLRPTPMEKEYLDGLLGEADGEQFQILLAHNPDYFPVYSRWGADLVLSGHVHGGVVRLPFVGGVISPALRLFPKYDGGVYKEGGSTMILSRGLGTHTLPVRIFNPGELVCIRLHACKS